VTWVIHGRCKSGSRWFWVAAAFDGGEVHKCDDPVCIYGGPHEYGWEDAEYLALKVMAEAVARLGGEVRRGWYQGNAPGQASAASSALKRLNAAKRAARPPSKETAAGVVEYLCGPWSWSDDYGETHKGISEYQMTKKTAKRIYYIRKPGCSEWNEPPTIGYIDRGEFEADTRCREDCPRDVPALVCGQHGRTDQHCVHFGEWCRVPPYATPPRLRNCGGRGCGEDCPRDVPAGECREHHYTWEHCPHGHWPAVLER
jgi:hypothetical protein